jgi:phage FluMu gp28-like protein
MITLSAEQLEELGLLPYQVKWLRTEERFKIGMWARQTGKDYTCAAEAAIACLAQPRQKWLILAASERQAIESLEKARDWVERLRKAGLFRKQNPPKGTATELRFANGSKIRALPGKPQTVRGFSANIILTEFAFHEHPEALWKAVFPMVTNSLQGGEKRVRIITTPNGQCNFFHELWREWKGYKEVLTIQEAKKGGLPVDLEALRAGLCSAEAWAQEYECQFTSSATALLPMELIETCESAQAAEIAEPGALSRCRGELFCGIDFGRKEHLTVCWTFERVAEELWTREVLVLEGMTTPEQFAELKPRVQLARRVCLDATGAGVGLADLLEKEFGGKMERCYFTQPFKQELFPRLRAAFERGTVRIPSSEKIRDDLHGVRRVVSINGQLSYRAAETEDGHSDRCTALALAVRAAESLPRLSLPHTAGASFTPRR